MATPSNSENQCSQGSGDLSTCMFEALKIMKEKTEPCNIYFYTRKVMSDEGEHIGTTELSLRRY